MPLSSTLLITLHYFFLQLILLVDIFVEGKECAETIYLRKQTENMYFQVLFCVFVNAINV